MRPLSVARPAASPEPHARALRTVPTISLALTEPCSPPQRDSSPSLWTWQVDAVTHGLINCGRRVANILFAIVWFRIPINLYNGVGISLALLGAFGYMQAKQYSSRQKAAAAQFPPKGGAKAR